MKRELKDKKMTSYKSAFGDAGFAIITEHGGMKVPVVESIRTEMAHIGCEVWVLKIGHRRDVYQRMEARMRTMEQWSEQQP